MWLRAAHVTLPNSWAWASKDITKKPDWLSSNFQFIVKDPHDASFVRSFEFYSDSMSNADFMSADNFDEVPKTKNIDMSDIIIWLNTVTVYDRFIITARNFYSNYQFLMNESINCRTSECRIWQNEKWNYLYNFWAAIWNQRKIHSNLNIELKFYFLHNVFSSDGRIAIYCVLKDDISYSDLSLPYRC